MSKRVLPILAITALTAGVTAAVATPVGAAPSSASQKVIVLLRTQHSMAGAVGARAKAAAATAADQAPLRAHVARLGGHTTRAYRVLNAVAATVPASAVAKLRADSSVAAVVPDLAWRLNRPASAATEASGTAAPTATDAQNVCPTNSNKPLLEPEALQLTHTRSDDPTAQTAASLGYDGTGVKVGFIADGVDIDQPDFIRADGSHVFTDYQDFSGDGTNSSSSGAEAMGDAGSIAAQGRKHYDISNFVNPAHPLPKGCTIRIEGMAPGSSLVGLKVFSNALVTAPTSTIIQAIDYAVNVDHVDVLNESFGSNPYPDNATDPISIFNHDAVNAGVTVVASTGDAGLGSSMGTASTDPWVIGVGGSTQERTYAQQTAYGFQLSNGHWTSNGVSALSSGGISQTNRVADLLAPGDLGWSICSARKLHGDPQYGGCVSDNNFAPANLQVFGGTSESAPLTAGAAALVIQAYRSTHGGASPTPGQVRRALDSSADDLGLPADEQGAGLLNSYRAVQIAAGMKGAKNTGQNLLLDKPAVSVVAAAGSPVSQTVTVSNAGDTTQNVSASLRRVDQRTFGNSQSLSISSTSPANTFLDSRGAPKSYVEQTFRVRPGTDRLTATINWPGPAGPDRARFSLLDPSGTFAGYSLPQGIGNSSRVDVHQPAAGTWTAIVWTAAAGAGYTGPVTLRTTDYVAASAGTVSPASFSLAPGASQAVTVQTTAPTSEAYASSLVLASDAGPTTTMPVVIRAVAQVTGTQPYTFHGTFDTANGRSFGPAQSDTYLFAVPAGAKDLDVDVHLTGTPANAIVAHLSDPKGEPISTMLNQHEPTSTDSGLQMVHANPMAGVWQLTIELLNPVSGAELPQNFTGIVALDRARVRASGVPTSTSTTISKSGGATQRITIKNTGPAPQTYFIDARSAKTTTYPLVATVAASATDPYTATIALPLPSEDVPSWRVPTETSRLTVDATATAPIEFDLMPLDSPTAVNAPNNPDIEATTSGNTGTAVHHATPVASALWAAFPSLKGPIPADGPPPGSVDMTATARTKAFTPDFTSSTGDPLLATVDSSAPAATPLVIPAGGSATVTVTLAPQGAVGSTQQGTLYVDVLQGAAPLGFSSYADELAAIPYAYTVGT